MLVVIGDVCIEAIKNIRGSNRQKSRLLYNRKGRPCTFIRVVQIENRRWKTFPEDLINVWPPNSMSEVWKHILLEYMEDQLLHGATAGDFRRGHSFIWSFAWIYLIRTPSVFAVVKMYHISSQDRLGLALRVSYECRPRSIRHAASQIWFLNFFCKDLFDPHHILIFPQ